MPELAIVPSPPAVPHGHADAVVLDGELLVACRGDRDLDRDGAPPVSSGLVDRLVAELLTGVGGVRDSSRTKISRSE